MTDKNTRAKLLDEIVLKITAVKKLTLLDETISAANLLEGLIEEMQEMLVELQHAPDCDDEASEEERLENRIKRFDILSNL